MIHAGAVEVGAGLAPEVKQMLEPRRGHERRARATSLEERVGRNRRSVREAVEVFGADCGGSGEHGLLLMLAGRNLRREHGSIGDEDGVRERPSDVDSEGTHVDILLKNSLQDERSCRNAAGDHSESSSKHGDE